MGRRDKAPGGSHGSCDGKLLSLAKFRPVSISRSQNKCSQGRGGIKEKERAREIRYAAIHCDGSERWAILA